MAADFSQARSLPYQLSGRTLFENVIIDNQHYAIVVDWKKGKLEPVAMYPLTTVQIPVWGGSWTGISPVITDPPNDASPVGENPPLAGTDFSALYMASDGTYMYFKLDLDDYPAAQCTYTVEFRQYLNQANTPGDLGAETIKQQKPDLSWIWNTMVWGSTGPVSAQSYGLWDDPNVQFGYKYLQFRVPLASLHYSNALGLQGIENRFVEVTVWGVEGSEVYGFRDGGPSFPYLPLIINFEPKQ
jgi:hypothetical protein